MMLLALFIFFAILMISGIAVDFMRFESNRMRVQATADRAVLAAATLRETGGDREELVEDYFDAAGLSEYLVEVQDNSSLNSGDVAVRIRPGIDTLFFRWVGTDELSSPAISRAREEVTNIEISLVIDISGSMRFHDSEGMPRITRLRSAAKGFIDQIFPENHTDTTTVSIIPYAGTVNPGREVFELLGGTAWHDYSSCPDIPRSAFGTTSLPDVGSMPQTPNFMHWPIALGMDWGWCPNEANSILYHSSDPDDLRQFLTDVRMHDGTGTHYGLRWGASLLDPSSRWLTEALADSGTIESMHDNRPAPWDDEDTMKVVVLMTDGKITAQQRPKRAGEGIYGRDGILPDEDEAELMETSHMESWSGNRRERITRRSENATDFESTCDLLKAEGVIIYTIAFETDDDGRAEMQDCASSSNYFDARGRELEGAFNAIANDILLLRLTL